MKRFDDLSVAVRLIGGYLIMVVLIVSGIVFSIGGLTELNSHQEEIQQNSLALRYLAEIEAHEYRLGEAVYRLAFFPEERAVSGRSIEEARVEVENQLGLLRTVPRLPGQEALTDQMERDWGGYYAEVRQVMNLIEQGQQAEALSAIAETGAVVQKRKHLDQSLTALVDGYSEQTTQIIQHGQDVYWYTTAVEGVGGILSVLFGLMLGFLLTNSITRPLRQTVAMVQAMGRGRLSERLNLTRKDEIGILARAVDQFASDMQNLVVDTLRQIARGDLRSEMVLRDPQDEIRPALKETLESLRALSRETTILSEAAADGRIMVRGNPEKFTGVYRDIVIGFNKALDQLSNPLQLIVEAAINLNSATAEIMSATTQQASGATQQSSAITQTTATVDEVKSISETSSNRAEQVAASAQRSVTVASDGRKAVEEMVQSMTQIRERVGHISENLLALSAQMQRIGEIITTVNEISTQSNMLALNASVEAARAGEYGRGFAVVALEVRNLADQSRSATLQVKNILGEIQKATNSTVMATEEGAKGVERGVQLARQAGQALDQLEVVIRESAQAASQMVAGGLQQRSGVDQIAIAIQNINEVTVQSLQNTRQTEKSAQNLNELAKRMAEAIRRYKI